jgi:hypothetical protein
LFGNACESQAPSDGAAVLEQLKKNATQRAARLKVT